jgi:hypothetical protein
MSVCGRNNIHSYLEGCVVILINLKTNFMRTITFKQVKDHLSEAILLIRFDPYQANLLLKAVSIMSIDMVTEQFLLGYIGSDLFLYSEPDRISTNVYKFEDGRTYSAYLPAGGTKEDLIINKM